MQGRWKAANVIDSLKNPPGGSPVVEAPAFVLRRSAIEGDASSCSSLIGQANHPELSFAPVAHYVAIRSYEHFEDMLFHRADW